MQQSFYSEKEMLADALTAEKTATTLYNTFSNECVHENVRNAILDCLEKEHTIQNEVFTMMHDRGYYPTPSAETQKVAEAKQKFGECMQKFR
ncbi:MAG: spore coat protein [Lachnospiraceae bacterium]|nr:spore coat protein [Lachnospiraceae bacterium]